MELNIKCQLNLMVIPEKYLNETLTDNINIIKACRDLRLAQKMEPMQQPGYQLLHERHTQWHIVVAAEPLPAQMGQVPGCEVLEAKALRAAKVTARHLCRVLGLPVAQGHGCVCPPRSAAELYARSLHAHHVYLYHSGWGRHHEGFKKVRALEHVDDDILTEIGSSKGFQGKARGLSCA